MNRNTKRIFLILFDSSIIASSLVITYLFLYPLVNIPKETFLLHMALVILIYLFSGFSFKLFDKINRFTSVRETSIHAIIVIIAYSLGTTLYSLNRSGISFRYVTFSFLISLLFLPTSRLVWRFWKEYTHNLNHA